MTDWKERDGHESWQVRHSENVASCWTESGLQGTRILFGMNDTNENVVGEEYPMCIFIFQAIS